MSGTDLFTDGGGQGSISQEIQEPAPDALRPPGIEGTMDFTFANAGGLTTSPISLSAHCAGNNAVAFPVRLEQEVAGAPPYAGGSVLEAKRTRINSMGSGTVLTQARSRTWTEPLVDVGSGSLVMLNDDPQLSGFSLDENDVIQWSLNGRLSYATFVEGPLKHVAIATGDEAEQGWTLGGRGHMACLERALVYPVNGVGNQPAQEDRIWDWTSPDYDDSSWPNTHIVTYVLWVVPAPYGAEGQWGPYNGLWDSNFRDVTAAIVWSPLGTIVNAPLGKCLFRWKFNVSNPGHYLLQAEIDNRGDVYLDSQLILSCKTYDVAVEEDVTLGVGQHTLAIIAENIAGGIPGFNPGGVAWGVYGYGYPLQVLTNSSQTGKMLAYPSSIPGMPPLMVMRHAIAEAKARGCFPYLNTAFSDFYDSNGVAMLDPANISTKVGTNYLTFFSKEIAETYVDLWMPPSGTTLYAFKKGTRGHSSGLVLAGSVNDATPGNMTGLEQEIMP